MLIKVNNIRINYELTGESGSPVVVLSHSLGSGLVMWEPQMKALNPHVQVLRYDIRGHGRSDALEGPYTLEQMAEDVVDLIDSLGIAKIHFVGLSLGGMIGQALALHHADRLESLSLCSTSSTMSQEAQSLLQERIHLVRTQGMGGLVEATLERWFTPGFSIHQPEMLALIRKQYLATSVKGFMGCAEAIRRLNYLDRLSDIHLPALIVAGEDDPSTPVSAAETIRAKISGSELVVLPSVRHLVNVEQPERFNDVLLEFINKHS